MPVLLALDDSQDVLAARSSLLTFAGFSVISCTTPQQALQHLQHAHVDIILTDYDMPGCNGSEFSHLARACGFTGPIVVSTGMLDPDNLDRSSIDHVIPKASTPHLLLKTLDACLKLPCRNTRISSSKLRSLSGLAA